MNFLSTIVKKKLFTSDWLLVGSGILLLFLAFQFGIGYERWQHQFRNGQSTVSIKNLEIPTNGAVIGFPEASVKVTAFVDYECGFCERHSTEVFPELVRNHITSGWVKYEVKPFPLKESGIAMIKAKAGFCLAQQDNYWNNQNVLYNSDIDTEEQLISSLSAKRDRLEQCMESNSTKQAVMEAKRLAEKKGVSATPSFEIGSTLHRGMIRVTDWNRALREEVRG